MVVIVCRRLATNNSPIAAVNLADHRGLLADASGGLSRPGRGPGAAAPRARQVSGKTSGWLPRRTDAEPVAGRIEATRPGVRSGGEIAIDCEGGKNSNPAAKGEERACA